MGKKYKLPPKKTSPITQKQHEYLQALNIYYETLTGQINAVYALLITTVLIPLLIYLLDIAPDSSSL